MFKLNLMFIMLIKLNLMFKFNVYVFKMFKHCLNVYSLSRNPLFYFLNFETTISLNTSETENAMYYLIYEQERIASI